MESREIDYIIVGVGRAGSVLAHQLLLSGKKIIVVNDPQLPCSSQVAAGLYNPITGKKFQKSWKAEQLFPYMEDFYREIEQLTGSKFLYPMPIVVPINSVEDQNLIHGKSALNESQHIHIHVNSHHTDLSIENPLGTFTSSHSGYLDVAIFLTASWQYFIKLNIAVTSNFDYQSLVFAENKVQWKNIIGEKIIFCEGYQAIHNPFFNWLPFTPNKGELLTVNIDNFDADTIFRKKVFLIPIAEGLYKCGSTYQIHYEHNDITPEACKELSEHLEDLIKTKYLVHGQYSGIRPATRDRKPFIGMHPSNESLVIFNGLGSKGVSLAPYFACQLIQHLEGKAQLDKEVNIERFYSWYANRV